MMDDFTPQISHIKQASNVIKDTKKKKKKRPLQRLPNLAVIRESIKLHFNLPLNTHTHTHSHNLADYIGSPSRNCSLFIRMYLFISNINMGFVSHTF